jgi:hypothetical protein
MILLRPAALTVLALLFCLAGGCSGYFTTQVRQAGLREELAVAESPDGAVHCEMRAGRSPAGKAAQLLLPVAWLLDGAASTVKVVDLLGTMAGWSRVIP